MEHSKRLALLLALAIASPTIAQEDESRAYFSISTQRTFAPGETPTVQLWGSGFDALEFRLYRVSDPVAFFQKLEEDHRFGGQSPRTGKQETALEKVRSWKKRWRTRMTNLMRAQFTRDSRRTVHAWRAERDAKANEGTSSNVQTFANVPVLNSQQLVAKWNQTLETTNRWESANVSIPVKGKGLYLVEATDGELQAYTIVSVTDIAAITKSAAGRVVTRVVRRDTGAPVPDCPVVILAGQKRDQRTEGKTDANGIYEQTAAGEAPEGRVVLARMGAEFAAVSVSAHELSAARAERTIAYIYTERPVYRPGHTVYFRAILRERQERGYQVPAPAEYSVEVQDSDGNSVHRERKTSSPMGTLSGEFKVPAAAPLGMYSVQLRVGENTQTGTFQVEEYKKPEYEVRITTSTKRMLQGEKVEATIDARYFYGEPVAKAKVTYVVHKSRYWLPYYMDDIDEESGGEDSPYADREQVLEETGELDEEGKLTVTIPTATAEYDLQYRIEGRVTDAAGREITGAGFVTATVGPYFLRGSADKYLYAPGEAVKVTVESRDYDGKAVGNVPFTVDLQNYSWRNRERHQSVATASGTTAANGSGTATVQLPKSGGSYRLMVTSKTPGGRTVADTEYLWVSGGADWSGARSERIEIVADKKSYAGGDTAHLLVIAGKPNSHVWVTVEGRALHRSMYVTAADGTAKVDVPIVKEFVPNIFVNAVMVRDNQLAQGSKSLKVPPDEFKLSLELTPSKTQFKPGEAGVYTLLAKDSAGKPVAGEFSVGVVDEAIYAVRPDGTPDIVKSFFGKEWSRVSTDSSLSYYFQGEAGKRRMQLAAIRPFRPRAQLKPDRLVEPKVRKAFPDTAFWSAAVRTDAAGRAEVRLNYPDALTTWRATVRGITADTKVGNIINKVIVKKNLLIRLSTPRFFRQGDTMTVTAIAQNLLPSEKKVRLSLEAKGLEMVEGSTQDVTVPSRGTATLDYRVRVTNTAAEAVLLGKALTDEESDALELTIPVIPFGVRMSQSRGGAISQGTAGTDAEIEFPADAEAGSRVMDVSASPSAAGAVFEALEYLTSFPYGCTEQTMSSFLPNVVVSKAVQTLGIKTSIKDEVLQKQIRAGLDRLYNFQHEDGGWGWWETDESDAFMTAYVVAGLSQARAAGVKVEEERLRNGANWLREAKSLDKADADLRAYAAYAVALAGSPNNGLADELYSQRGRLSAYATALTGLAFDAAKDGKRAGEMAASLEKSAKSSDLETWWESMKDNLMDIEVDSSPEATAYAMKLLSRLKPDSALLPKAALYLVNHRNQGYYWNSTKQTAMVIYGLTEFVSKSGELKPNFTATVYVNDKAVLTKRFAEGDALAPAAMRLTAAQLAPGKNKIRVTRDGPAGRLYWSARGGYFSATPQQLKSGDKKLSVNREYFKLTPNKSGDKIVYDMEPVKGAAKQGDLIAVKVSVSGDDWRYLMVEDPIPAGAELVERDELYEFRNRPDWWERWFTKRELRDDRAVFFQTWWSRGDNRFFYLMKIVNPGQFRVSPTRVEPMYQPQYFAAGEPTNLEVTR